MQDLTAKAVVDVVVRLPRTLAPGASVAEARAAFADRVHMLLVIEADGRLLGTLVRDDLPDGVDESGPALEHAVLQDRTVPPDAPAEVAFELLTSRGERRRAVVDQDGKLLGLLCLKRRLTGFCADSDDQALRAMARSDHPGVAGTGDLRPAGANYPP